MSPDAVAVELFQIDDRGRQEVNIKRVEQWQARKGTLMTRKQRVLEDVAGRVGMLEARETSAMHLTES
jgi:hypothetical protein